MDIDRNEFFRQVAVRICGSLDIERALEESFLYIREVVPVSSMALGLYDPALDVVHILASVGMIKDKGFGRIVSLPPVGIEFRANKWATLEAVEIVNQPDTIPAMEEISKALNIDLHSRIHMRLELEGNRIGILVLLAEGENRYTDVHAELIGMVHDPFAIAMANAMRHQEILTLKDMLTDDNRYLRRSLRELAGEEIVGAEFGLREVMTMVRQVAPLDSPILLYGETGVGKEVIANAIHYASPRREGPFIKVNCGAIPESLIDSELFGHEKGAFTGAISRKRGRFERAHGGTIFLDEIGELPPQAQVRLLNVIQNREIERVGGTETIPVDIRVISATHRRLEDMIQAGEFREDLWFRLNVVPITIPPLRQRKEDIPALVHHFIERKGIELRIGTVPTFAPGSLERLKAYDWPGNVRELQNIVERALIQSRGQALRFDKLLAVRPEANAGPSLSTDDVILTLEELNREHIIKALALTGGRINGARGGAALLGIHPNTLRKRMDKLGISYKRGR